MSIPRCIASVTIGGRWIALAYSGVEEPWETNGAQAPKETDGLPRPAENGPAKTGQASLAIIVEEVAEDAAADGLDASKPSSSCPEDL
jgi:hypothetical protein